MRKGFRWYVMFGILVILAGLGQLVNGPIGDVCREMVQYALPFVDGKTDPAVAVAAPASIGALIAYGKSAYQRLRKV